MEESLSLLGAIRKKFVCDRVDIRTYSPLTLAFVGDCIYDLVIRTIVVERGNTAPGVLHTKKSSIVKAQAQAAQADALMEELTAEEQAVIAEGGTPIPIRQPKCIDRGLPQGDRIGSTVWIFIPDRPDRPAALADCERAGADRAANMIK